MEQEYKPKPIDKEYLTSSLKDFDSEILSKKYLQTNDEQLHTHANGEVLNRLNVSDTGALLFDGNEINKNELFQLFENNNVLNRNIEEETDRAKEAEKIIADHISAEQDRAFNRENVIENQVSTESEAIRQLIDLSYASANGYTDDKIAKLINGAPSTLDTLKEIADALTENDDVVKALNDAIGSKTDQAEFDAHMNNQTIHVTASDMKNLSTPAFTQASSRAAIESEETLSILFGKIKKWFADLEAVAFSGNYNDLIDKPVIPTKTSQLTNDAGYKSTDNDTRKANTASSEGYVAPGTDHANQVWKTDENGNPAWRDEAAIRTGAVLAQTLTAGATTLTFTDDAITDDSMIDVYTDPYCDELTSVEQDGNSLTLTFEAQSAAMRVCVKVG